MGLFGNTMYHIKKDIRTRKSADRVLDALTECLKTKKLTDISYTDLQKSSGVGRSTIYRIFDTNADILAYGCDMFAESLNREYLKMTQKSHPTKRDFALFIMSGWMGNYKLLDAINMSRCEDILEKSIVKYRQGLPEFDEKLILTPVQIEYLTEIAAASVAAVFKVWLRHGRKESAEELYEILSKMDSNF